MTDSGKRNIFVLGLDEWNREQLESIRGASNYRFHSLLDYDELVNPSHYPVARLLEKARDQLREFPGEVNGIIGHWDFPTSTLLPFLNAEFGLHGACIAAVMRCEHKYLSRRHQQIVAPHVVPRFQVINPFQPPDWSELDLRPPFWIKPVKAFSSYLGFRIRNQRDFEHALEANRIGIGLIGEPFNYLLGKAGLENETGIVDGFHCIAEEIISGHQCTLEGYVHRGTPHVYGVVDSFRGPNHSSFERYEYPSTLPRRVQERMIQVAGHFLEAIGYDNAPFNMEFFHDRRRDLIHLLEVNPRISKSHCPLFQMVTGASHHEVAVEVSQGIQPAYPQNGGGYRRAAKFMLRRYTGDATVAHAPHAEEIAEIEALIPGVRIHLHVRPGMRLSQLPSQDQDSYSYEVAMLFVGADSRRALFNKAARARDLLDIRYTEADPETRPGLPLSVQTATRHHPDPSTAT